MQNPYDLSHLVEDPKLKQSFRTEAWQELVRMRIEIGGETQQQAADFIMQKYGRGGKQPDSDEPSTLQHS